MPVNEIEKAVIRAARWRVWRCSVLYVAGTAVAAVGIGIATTYSGFAAAACATVLIGISLGLAYIGGNLDA